MLVDRNEHLLSPWNNQEHIRCHQGRIEDMEDWLPQLGERPRAVVLTYPIADTSALVAERLNKVDPQPAVIARCQYQSQIDQLHQAGVRAVICDEHATASALHPILTEVLASIADSRHATLIAVKKIMLKRKHLSLTRRIRAKLLLEHHCETRP